MKTPEIPNRFQNKILFTSYVSYTLKLFPAFTAKWKPPPDLKIVKFLKLSYENISWSKTGRFLILSSYHNLLIFAMFVINTHDATLYLKRSLIK